MFLINEQMTAVSCDPRPTSSSTWCWDHSAPRHPSCVPAKPATLLPLPLPTESCSKQTHLWSLVKERVPYFKEDVTNDAIHKHHQKPVERDEGVVHFVLFKVGMQSRQLLAHEVSEHPLVHLEREQRGEVYGGCHCTEQAIRGPGGAAGPSQHTAAQLFQMRGGLTPEWTALHPLWGEPEKQLPCTLQVLTKCPLTVILSTGYGGGFCGLKATPVLKMPHENGLLQSRWCSRSC